MLTDEELAALPEDPVQAFVIYEAKWRQHVRKNTSSTWDAEREYVHAILAYIHEYDLEVAVNEDIPTSDGFYEFYNDFINKIDYYINRFRLRNASVSKSKLDTTLYLTEDYRLEAQRHIVRIRNIVANIADMTEAQRQSIYDKLGALSQEVNRSRTRAEAWTDLWLYTTKAVGDGFTNLTPVQKAIERLGEVLAKVRAANVDGQIPPPPQRKLLAKPNTEPSDLDDEIPF